MDPSGSGARLNLNFGPFSSPSNKAYPTTPSSFPRPVSPPGQQHQLPTNNFAQSYFATSPYGTTQQAQAQAQYAASFASPQQGYPNRPYNLDGNGALAHQYPHQDFGASRVAYQSNSRGMPAPGRPRTSHSQGAGGHGHASSTGSRGRFGLEDDELPKNPEKYSDNVHKRGRGAKELVNVFFLENIERARDRNVR